MLTENLRRLETDGMTLEQLVEASYVATGLSDTYARHDVPAPEWLVDVQSKLDADIQSRQRDAQLKRLREIELAEQGLLSAREKREKLGLEAAAIRKKLGIKAGAATK